MRKYLRFARLFVLGAGAVGMLLMLWLFSAGTDVRGLYPAKHPGWVLLWILTGLVAVTLWLLSRQAGLNRNYRQNFPASFPAALGCLAGAVGLLTGGIQAFGKPDLLHILTGLCGIGGCLSLLLAGFCRFRGEKSVLPVHILPCFFFAFELFVLGQQYGDEPEMCRYLYRFFASAALVPACYWLWGFEVNLTRRPACLFWCLLAAYCSLIAVAGGEQWMLYGGTSLWMLTAVPKLRYLPKPPRPRPAPAQEPVSESVAEQEAPVPDPLAFDLPDVDSVLNELLQDFGKKDTPNS